MKQLLNKSRGSLGTGCPFAYCGKRIARSSNADAAGHEKNPQKRAQVRVSVAAFGEGGEDAGCFLAGMQRWSELHDAAEELLRRLCV